MPLAVDVTTGAFAKDMFTDGAAHLKRWGEKGHSLKPQTIAQHRRHLINCLLPQFWETPLGKIRPAKVEDFLLEQKLSNSTRNTILYTLALVMQEARRDNRSRPGVKLTLGEGNEEGIDNLQRSV